MFVPSFIRGLLVLSLLIHTVHAQDNVATDPCAPKFYRWQEDCRALATQAEPLKGVQRLRYVPLTTSGSVWLTLGGEYRLKTESLADPLCGIHDVRAYTATGERFLIDADLRTRAGPRVFVQLSAATHTGRTPAERPFDKSAADLAQAFVDLPVSIDTADALIRVGRQELDFGGKRLVAVRDAANLRLAFDLALLSVIDGPFFGEIFAGHPVLNRVNAFDDEATPGEEFWGSWLKAKMGQESGAPAAEFFFFGRRRAHVVYQDAVGVELRRTFGIRLSGREHGWDYATQAAIQRGRSADKDIKAYAIAGDFGYSWSSAWQPRLGMSFGNASGDRSGGDGTLGTFDVLYPNLGYCTDAPLTYPGNDRGVQPNITLKPFRELSVQSGVDVLFRSSSHDAIYAPPGIALIRGNGHEGNFITALSYLKAVWRLSPHVEWAGSYVHASVGPLVKDHGGRDANYGFVQLTLRL